MLRRTQLSCVRHRQSSVPPAFIKPRSRLQAEATPPVPEGREAVLSEYKTPFVIRPFIKDNHLAQLQHIDFGGMYRRELAVSRSKHPRLSKSLTINTDGSLSERDFEVATPPVIVLFSDRHAHHQFRMSQMAKTNRLEHVKTKPWLKAEKQDAYAEKYDTPVCNALCFPYCVPSKSFTKRGVVFDPLDPRFKMDTTASSS